MALKILKPVPNADSLTFRTGEEVPPAGATPARPVPAADMSGAGAVVSGAPAPSSVSTGDAAAPSVPASAGTERAKAVDEYLSGVGNEAAASKERADYASGLAKQETVADFLARAQKEQGIPDLLTSLDATRQAAAQAEVSKRAAERQTAEGTGYVTQSGLAGLRAADSKEYVQKLADLAIVENATVANINARNSLISQSLAARKQDMEDKKAAYEARIAALAVSDDRKEAMKALLNARLADIAKKEENAAAVAMAKQKDLLETGDVNSADPDLRKKAIVNAINAQVAPYAKYGVALDVPAEAHAAQIMAAMAAGKSYADAFRENFSEPFQAKASVANIKDQLSGGEWKPTTVKDAYGTETPLFYRKNGDKLEVQDIYGKKLDPSVLAPSGATVGSGKPMLPPAVQTRVDKYSLDYENEPTVKEFSVVKAGSDYINELAKKGKPDATDGQAAIYAFAKAMDPNSVVREGEYATVQKYAQTWKDTLGINVNRVLGQNELLTQDAVKNMARVVAQKYAIAKKNYENVRNETARQINQFTGRDDGQVFLKDYAKGYGSKTAADYYGAVKGGKAPAASADVPDEQILAGRKNAATAQKKYDVGSATGNAKEEMTADQFWSQYREQRDALAASGDAQAVKNADELAQNLAKKLGIPADTSEHAAKIDADIRRVAPGAKLDGKIISQAAADAGVDPRYVAAFLANDSGYGTRGIGARNNNPGNVGQYDRLGTTPAKGYGTIQEGVKAAADNLAKRVAAYKQATGRDDPTVEELASGKTRGGVKFFGPYMTDAQGPTRVRAIFNRISNAA